MLVIISFIAGYFAGCIQVPYLMLKVVKGVDIIAKLLKLNTKTKISLIY